MNNNDRLDSIIQAMNRGFDQMNQRFDEQNKYIDQRFEAVDKKFEAVDKSKPFLSNDSVEQKLFPQFLFLLQRKSEFIQYASKLVKVPQ